MTRARVKPGPSDETLRDLAVINQKIQEYTEQSRELRRQCHAEFDDGYIYVVQFSSGVVKPGKTRNPDWRMGQHARLAEFHGAPIVRSWVSGKHLGISQTERRLLKFCEETGTCLSGEYFADVRFEAAREFGRWIVDGSLLRFYLDWLVEAVDGDVSRTVAEALATAQADLAAA